LYSDSSSTGVSVPVENLIVMLAAFSMQIATATTKAAVFGQGARPERRSTHMHVTSDEVFSPPS
jgi:hypothetical protein